MGSPENEAVEASAAEVPDAAAGGKRDLIWLAVPLLFAAYRPIAFYAQNVDQMTLADLGMTLLVACLAAVVITGVLYAIFRRVEPAALITSLLFVAFYSYGMVFDGLTGIAAKYFRRIGRLGIPPDAVLMVAVLVAGGLIIWAVARKKPSGREAVQIAAAIGVTLVALATFQAFQAAAAAGRAEALSKPAAKAVAVANRAKASPTDPDIYFVVLDRYMNEPAMKQLTDYDNTPFLDELRAEGFAVANDAFSNYSITYTSLASSLNMKYVDEYTNLPGYEKKNPALQVNRDVFYDLIGSSLVARELQKRGYDYVHVSSGWAATADSKIADRVVNTTENDEYLSGFLDSTLAKPFAAAWTESNQRLRVLSAFDALTSVKSAERPAFVFAHILSPHPPYVFAADGSDPHYDKAELRKSGKKTSEAYIGQVQYVNKLVLERVRQIKAKRGDRPVIIIVQGDHGANYWVRGKQNSADDARRRKNQILYAIYFSDGKPSDIRDVETPVNTFRIVFDRIFGTQLGRLPDKAFYSSTETWPYWPYEITKLMSKSPSASVESTTTP